MKIPLLKGSFTPAELEKIITELVQVKIRYHENKIQGSDEEETMKMRENRIIKLQNDLQQVRNFLKDAKGLVNAEGEISLTINNGRSV